MSRTHAAPWERPSASGQARPAPPHRALSPGPRRAERLAVLHAVLARSALADAARPLPLRERDAEAQARRAVAVLERARQAGWFRDQRAREEMNKDKNLAVLRDRADFRQWAAGLGTGGKRR